MIPTTYKLAAMQFSHVVVGVAVVEEEEEEEGQLCQPSSHAEL